MSTGGNAIEQGGASEEAAGAPTWRAEPEGCHFRGYFL